MAPTAPARKAPAARKGPRAKAGAPKLNGISSEAVERATGKTWAQWLATLKKDGAAEMTHQEIARHLRSEHGIGQWWCQMVTVGYEQGSGRRQKHQMSDGFRIGGSKTVHAPLKSLFRAWADPAIRQRWLPEADLAVRTSSENKSMRITWDASAARPTSLLVAFYAKGPAKSQVTVEHGKLASAASGEKLKRFWCQRLAALSILLTA